VASRRRARTRGFAAPAFAGCAFVEGLATLSYRAVRGLSSDQRAARYGFPKVMCGFASNMPTHQISHRRSSGPNLFAGQVIAERGKGREE
jgi:hypothetical protein